MKARTHHAVAMACLAAAAHAFAQGATLPEAAQKAVLGNPEVLARWHAFRAAAEEQDVARGNYYPRIDVTAGTGRERLDQPLVAERDFSRRGATLSLNQMLFDGFATSSEVRRLGEGRLARYYELLDASETAAAEAARAYHDVRRFRSLVRLAEDNYARHRQLFEQIESRVQAGVGRRVDLEQAGGRMALADANLITETSNLHDVSARYQRIVGELPRETMAEPPPLAAGLPQSGAEAIRDAIGHNPALKAAVANLRAAQAEARGSRAGFFPRLDLRARQDWERNREGIIGPYEDRVVEVVANFNLFRGGADAARTRQFAERLNQARDLRDKSCRDLRQTLAIAYNDTRRYAEQLSYLDQHQLATEKVREAYRRQFDIGQRSLLDLLDTENELFQARRAYANAQTELAIAQARAHAASGTLLSALGLTSLPAQADEHPDADPAAADVSAACPPEAVPVPVADRPAALARLPAVAPPSLPRPEHAAAAGEESVRRAVADWARAWSARDHAGYMSFYAPDFRPEGGLSRAQWQAQRRQRLAAGGAISVAVDALAVRMIGADSALADFRQTYTAPAHRDVVLKTLEWKRSGERWLIVRESQRPASSASKPEGSAR